MVRQARILAQATSDLVNAIKMDAEGESDLENSRKLLSAAKLLADATAKMVEAAKVYICLFPFICLCLTQTSSFHWICLMFNGHWPVSVSPQGAAANPDSEEQQQKLREAAEGLRMATNAAAQNAIKKRLVNKLEVKRKEEKQRTNLSDIYKPWLCFVMALQNCWIDQWKAAEELLIS